MPGEQDGKSNHATLNNKTTDGWLTNPKNWNLPPLARHRLAEQASTGLDSRTASRRFRLRRKPEGLAGTRSDGLKSKSTPRRSTKQDASTAIWLSRLIQGLIPGIAGNRRGAHPVPSLRFRFIKRDVGLLEQKLKARALGELAYSKTGRHAVRITLDLQHLTVQRLRLCRDREASRDMNRLLNKPGFGFSGNSFLWLARKAG